MSPVSGAVDGGLLAGGCGGTGFAAAAAGGPTDAGGMFAVVLPGADCAAGFAGTASGITAALFSTAPFFASFGFTTAKPVAGAAATGAAGTTFGGVAAIGGVLLGGAVTA